MQEQPPLRPPETGAWGDLPPYLQRLQRRGTDVAIPERYRKLFEAYVKRNDRRR